jgi:hypothetical protein
MFNISNINSEELPIAVVKHIVKCPYLLDDYLWSEVCSKSIKNLLIQSYNSMKRFSIILVVFILLPGMSCKQKEHRALLPKVNGMPGEVLMVIDNYLWDSPLGNFFSETFNQPFEVLPADEPIYDIIHIPWNGFSKLFKSHRNIVLIKISDENKEPRILVQNNVWATPQLVLNIVGPNDKSLIAYLEQNQEKLIDLLNVSELNRTIGNYRKNMAKGLDEVLKTNHKIGITVPFGYKLDVDTSDFVWISHEVSDMTQGVLIYHYPYTDSNTFTLEFLLSQRDFFTRTYVPGPTKGSYMTTEHSFPVNFRENVKDGQYMVELRGLWKTEKAFMGGPFISHTILDEKRNRIVTAEGFVFAPGLDKRNYIRELSAILQTVEIID